MNLIPSSFFLIAISPSPVFSLSSFTSNPWSNLSSTSFLRPTVHHHETTCRNTNLVMRKQKASNKRTSRLQRGDITSSILTSSSPNTLLTRSISSPMDKTPWDFKDLSSVRTSVVGSNDTIIRRTGTRSRAAKRLQVYTTLSTYHSHFLNLLTTEFAAEEALVRDRIEYAIDDPLSLEMSGYAMFDMYPERRGNIFSDEVYRLVKAKDSTTTSYQSASDPNASTNRLLPPNHKFSSNDVIMLTLQRSGSGDFYGSSSVPTSDDAITLEARVLNSGPTYIDIACSAGAFEATFGPAPNNGTLSGRGSPNLRLRADIFFSNVPYTRMVMALAQLTAPKSSSKTTDPIHIDEVLRTAILSTFSTPDESLDNKNGSNISNLARELAKPPLSDSTKYANEVLGYLQINPDKLFPEFNGPQLSAIGASLTRRLTMIQGPPGTGKTTVAASIAFGFVHQCRNMPGYEKVLACAFSNVGADNLAEKMIKLGLKVIRVGKASGVSSSLWDYTLDAAIDKDPDAQKAIKAAAKATANLRLLELSSGKVDAALEKSRREAATQAVKASIEACNVAATKAMRAADVVVSTSIGAADSRLLAACGIVTSTDEEVDRDRKSKTKNNVKQGKSEPEQSRMTLAPDNLPPLSLPFVIMDEACQSVEPASLIPIIASNSCRSLVMLGDPCQLPPTVVSDPSGNGSSELSVSLMTRLASSLPHPVIVTAKDDETEKEQYFLKMKPTRQAVSLMKYRNNDKVPQLSYRKRFAGSLLLSVQYRMHPSISAFSSSIFYDGLLSTPSFLTEQRPFPTVLQELFPAESNSIGVRFVNVGGRCNERQGIPKTLGFLVSETSVENKSYMNEKEAAQIISLLKDMLSKSSNQEQPPEFSSIGIVTPYASQVSLLKTMISSDSEFKKLVQKSNCSIEVNSVDAYQGRERDLIIFSSVRSNRKNKIGFLKDWRRMNVAITRAKLGMIVFGDLETLKSGDKHWEAFCQWCEGMGCVFDALDKEDYPSNSETD